MALTIREKDLLETYISNDCELGIKQIADKKFISPRTAETHFNKAKKKYGVHTLTGLVFAYLRENKHLLVTFFVATQLASSLNFDRNDIIKRKRGRKTARIVRVQKVQTKTLG